MGKMVVPNMFIYVDLLKVIVVNYEPLVRVVRAHDGQIMVWVNKEEVAYVFKLNTWSSDMVKIDEQMLREEYKWVKHNFRVSVLTNFLILVGNGINKRKITLGPSDVDPLPIKYLQPYFQKTFYSLCQILGLDLGSSILVAHMYMAASIQHLNINTLYDFSTYIA